MSRAGPSLDGRQEVGPISGSTLREWTVRVLRAVEDIGRAEYFADPDADWESSLLMARENELAGVVQLIPFLAKLDHQLIADVVIPKILRTVRAQQAALILSVWEVAIDRQHLQLLPDHLRRIIRDGRISLLPAELRREAVLVHTCDGLAEETWKAIIRRRRGQRPTLAPWQKEPAGALGPLRDALRNGWVPSPGVVDAPPSMWSPN